MRFVLVLFLVACRPPNNSELQADAKVDDGQSYPAPNSGVFPAVGAEATLEIASWNIENFPASADIVSDVADIVASLDVDLLAVQEIADEPSFIELDDRLTDFSSVLSTHQYGTGEYQKLAVLYRDSELEVIEHELLFEQDGYLFPRPPLAIHFRRKTSGQKFWLVNVHLKAGWGTENRERRNGACNALAAVLRSKQDSAILVGDFNEVVTTSSGREVLRAWYDDDFDFVTAAVAQEGEVTFLPSDGMIDHVITKGMPSAREVVVKHLEAYYPNLVSEISDHIPVVAIYN